MSQKTDKLVQNIMNNNNVHASKNLEEILREKIEQKMRKVLAKQTEK